MDVQLDPRLTRLLDLLVKDLEEADFNTKEDPSNISDRLRFELCLRQMVRLIHEACDRQRNEELDAIIDSFQWLYEELKKRVQPIENIPYEYLLIGRISQVIDELAEYRRYSLSQSLIDELSLDPINLEVLTYFREIQSWSTPLDIYLSLKIPPRELRRCLRTLVDRQCIICRAHGFPSQRRPRVEYFIVDRGRQVFEALLSLEKEKQSDEKEQAP